MEKCQLSFCNKNATYDAKLKSGPWAYVCNDHFKANALKVKGTYTELPE